MDKIKVFICTHKDADFRHNDIYTPLLLKRFVWDSIGEEGKDFFICDTGDNIYSRNPNYCELTGMYWIWKNYHNSEYVAITQYRRSFVDEFTEDNIDSYFEDGTDVIMASRYPRYNGRLFTVLTYMQMEDFLIMRGVIRKLHPEYLDTLNRYLHDYIDHPFNMMVCRKELYDKYAEFIFSICFEMEKYIKPSAYCNAKRLYGYVAELLTPIFFIHNKCKIRDMDITFDGRILKFGKKAKAIMWLCHNTIYRFTKDHPLSIDPSFLRSLKIDGIDLDCS